MAAADLRYAFFLRAFSGLAIRLAILFSVVLLAGCGGQYNLAKSAPTDSERYDSTSSFEPKRAKRANSLDAAQANANDEAETASVATRAAIANRRIIYNTDIGLVVEDYDSFENQLPVVVAQRGGFIANSNTDRRHNNNQYGTWIVRVPVVEYAEFLSGISALGFAESRKENAQDVTEEYVDIEARIKNKKQLEVRVLEMLDQRKGPLKDVLEIERELARIRGDVERMEGRLRFLKDRTSLATVTITCREEKEYQPATAPTLASRISNAWINSMASLQRGGENVLVGVVAAIPWIVLIGIGIGLLATTRRFWLTFWRKTIAPMG